jgi:hypothetical protein
MRGREQGIPSDLIVEVFMFVRWLLLMTAVVMWSSPAKSQDPKAPSTAVELTPEEIKERDGRKACKVAICAAFHNRAAGGADIACSVLKTWRKEHLNGMLEKAKVSWPWGRIRCTADIRLKRETLVKAMTEPKYEAELDRHEVACEVEREKEANAEIKFDFSPRVVFENGKAVKATLNWGKIEAPALVKGAMWTATATDNTFNVLQGTLVQDINEFIADKCQEVKDEWAAK